MTEKKLTADEVRGWLAGVESDMSRLGERVEPLLAEQKRLEERRALLEGLLRSFSQANGPEPHVASRPAGSVADYVVARAVDILREEGGPLNINDLHARFIERGYPIPGAGKTVNLIVHLRTSGEIVSPRRGMYALAEHTDAAVAAPRRRRKKRATRARRAES